MPVWVNEAVVLALHDEQLAEHGGAGGVKDLGLLQSALARPRNLAAYEDADMAALAACYAFGLARNHAFIDGNKRASLVVTEVFLALNGLALEASDAECLDVWMRLSAGEISEAEMAAWLRARIGP